MLFRSLAWLPEPLRISLYLSGLKTIPGMPVASMAAVKFPESQARPPRAEGGHPRPRSAPSHPGVSRRGSTSLSRERTERAAIGHAGQQIAQAADGTAINVLPVPDYRSDSRVADSVAARIAARSSAVFISQHRQLIGLMLVFQRFNHLL